MMCITASHLQKYLCCQLLPSPGQLYSPTMIPPLPAPTLGQVCDEEVWREKLVKKRKVLSEIKSSYPKSASHGTPARYQRWWGHRTLIRTILSSRMAHLQQSPAPEEQEDSFRLDVASLLFLLRCCMFHFPVAFFCHLNCFVCLVLWHLCVSIKFSVE